VLTRVVTPRRIGFAILLGLAVAGLVVAVGNGRPNPTAVSDRSAEIDALIPTPGSEVLRQAPVGIDLVPGFTATLTVNGVPVPEDELRVDLSLGRFLYLPGEGTIALNPGPNVISATYWPIAEGPERSRTETWVVNVL
jgi:hypothetical protein